MKKSFVAVITLLLLLSIPSFGQMKFTLNGGYQMPTGTFKDGAKSGFGGSLSLDYSLPLLPVSLAFTAGYNKWNFKDNLPTSGYNFHAIPLMAGVRYYSGGPYVGADVGFSLSNSNAPGASSSTDFTFSPIIGYRFGLTPVGITSLDLNVRYWNISSSGSSINWIGFNAGIAFGL